MGCALVKISASSPMPTSRYCDQAPASISVFFRARAWGEPGFRRLRSPPSWRSTSARMAIAFSGAPLACSSMTRSSMDRAKVTPAALTACRSIGASSQGLVSSRLASGVLARMASRVPRSSPVRLRSVAAGSAVSQSSVMVGTAAVISITRPASIRTTDGPATSGRQTRPARAAEAWSSGRVAAAVRRSRISQLSFVGPSRPGSVPATEAPWLGGMSRERR